MLVRTTRTEDSMGQTSLLEMLCTPNNQRAALSRLQIDNVGGENLIFHNQCMVSNIIYELD